MSEDCFRRLVCPLPRGEMAALAFGPAARPVDIVFLHATGLNARAYRTLLAPLSERFHVVALDLRGHGRTQLPTGRFGYASWNRHRNDVIAFIETAIGAPVTLAGHSLGAVTATLVAGRRPDLVRGLCLIEPVLMSPGAYALMLAPGAPKVMEYGFAIARKARKRRARFDSREAATAALTGRGFFRTLPPDAIEDYVADGSVDTEDGVSLACAPKYEARTFSAQRHDPWGALKRAQGPLIVLRAEKGSTCPPAAARRIAALRPDARLAMIEGASHALPFERADRARAAIETTAILSRSGASADVF